MHGRYPLVVVLVSPRLLDVGAAALVLQATALGACARLGLGARALHVQGLLDPAREPFQRQLSIAGLGARVLRHGRDARSELRTYPRFLKRVETAGREHVEDRFDLRFPHVRMLTAGT